MSPLEELMRALEAKVRELEPDAMRYRWLRTVSPFNCRSIAWGTSTEACKHSEPDAAIDAAMLEARKK